MSVPDDVVFGPKGDGTAFYYSDVRAMDENAKIVALRLRLSQFLFDQTDQLGFESDGERKSAFPLAIMCCVATDCMGQVMFGRRKDRSSFSRLLTEVDPAFYEDIDTDFHEELKQRWPGKQVDSIAKFSDLIYKTFRNSMIHGYLGQAVYLTDKDDVTSSWNRGEGFLRLNPYWMWRRLKAVSLDLFERSAAGESPLQSNSLRYVQRMIE